MAKKRMPLMLGAVLPVLITLSPAAVAQVPAAPSPLDVATRGAVVATAAQALRTRYVFPDVGERAAAAIEAALAAGDYGDIDDPWSFAERLTADLRAVAADKHLDVTALGPPPATSGTPPPAPLHSEAGVTRSDRLPGNIGYIEVVAFPAPELFGLAVDRAMAPLADTDALIIDVRRNGGGSPVSVAHLVSYFIEGDEPVHINSFVWRNPGTETFRREEFWSTTPAFSYAGKPVYVLTSGATFSGGEEFAYDMQVMELGVIVGETTGGGANPGGSVPLAPGFVMFVPGGRAENPITGTNWEGVGVQPDIEVPSAEALGIALERLGHIPTTADIDGLSLERFFEPRTTPHPASEAAVRRMSAELARGEPDYSLLTPSMAEATRTQLDALQRRFSDLGPLVSIEFVEVDPLGADVYDIQYENGPLRLAIALTQDGKAAMAAIRPSPPLP
ncbi:MAG TPA: S41 family peptidase [Gammaproteobacteria bacterium]